MNIRSFYLYIYILQLSLKIEVFELAVKLKFWNFHETRYKGVISKDLQAWIAKCIFSIYLER